MSKTTKKEKISMGEHRRLGYLLRDADSAIAEISRVIGNRPGIRAKDIDKLLRAIHALEDERFRLEDIMYDQHPHDGNRGVYRDCDIWPKP